MFSFAFQLESIPGFDVNQSTESLVDIVDKVGCCIVGQTADLAPADKVTDDTAQNFLIDQIKSHSANLICGQ